MEGGGGNDGGRIGRIGRRRLLLIFFLVWFGRLVVWSYAYCLLFIVYCVHCHIGTLDATTTFTS